MGADSELELTASVVAIFVGGFLPASREPSFEPYFPVALPTLHVIGKTDTLVTEERSMTLVHGSTNARVEKHEGGEYCCL